MPRTWDDETERCVDLQRTVIAQSGNRNLLELAVAALVAVAGFFSWIMLVDSLQISYWLYYERTIYLIYLGRSLDPIAWVLASVFAVLLLAGTKKSRLAWLWPGILLLWLGIVLGTLGLAGLGRLSIAAGSLMTLIGLVVGANAVFKELASTSRGYFLAVILLVLSLLILPAELGSLTYYVLSAFHPGTRMGSSWELFEMQLWYTAFPLVPFLYVAFLFSWIWAPLVARIIPGSAKHAASEIAESTNRSESRAWILVIGAYIVLAAFLGYYAYFQSPTYPLLGTDIYWRNVLPAERVLASESWIAAAANERHPVVVLGIAVLANVLRLSVESLLRFAYVGLILAFGAAVFLLVLVASSDRMLASMSALISTVMVPTTSGMYTGTVANWVALIVWVLSLACLVRIKGHGIRGYLVPMVGLCVGSLAVLFIHPWTWLAVMVGLVAFPVVAAIFQSKGVARDVGSVVIVILLNAGALAASLEMFLKSQGWRLVEAFSDVQGALGSQYFGLGSWEIVVFFSQIWAQFLNPMFLVLSVLGALVLARKRNRLSAIIFAWIIAAFATSMLAAPMGYVPLESTRGETQLFRAMFLTPFQIPSAAGFLFVGSIAQTRLPMVAHPRAARIVLWVAMAVMLLAMINGAFRALFPLLTDAHNYPNPLAP